MRFENFKLSSNTKSKFEVAKFERQIYKSHFSRLKKAIVNKEMIDNIITVIPNGNRFRIIDGQHRFNALIDLLEEGLQKEFVLHLRILDEPEVLKDGVESYIRLDSGKPLTAKDILKAYYNPILPFFKILSTFCTNYGDSKNLSYYEVLVAYKYAITGNRTLNRYDIQKTLLDVKSDDCQKLAYLISNLYTLTSRNVKHFIFKTSCFRNLFRVLYANPILIKKQKSFQSFLKECMSDNYIQTNCKLNSSDTYNAMFTYLVGMAQRHITDMILKG